MNRTPKTIAALATLALLAGCGEGDPVEQAPRTNALPESYWMSEPPAEPAPVKRVREEASSGDDVLVEGRVRDLNPSRALLQLTDLDLLPCNERPEDSCPTPWDYCCEEPGDLNRATVTVEFREDDRLLEAGLEGFHGLDRLKRVVVQGRAVRDEAGNLTVVAERVHVRP